MLLGSIEGWRRLDVHHVVISAMFLLDEIDESSHSNKSIDTVDLHHVASDRRRLRPKKGLSKHSKPSVYIQEQ